MAYGSTTKIKKERRVNKMNTWIIITLLIGIIAVIVGIITVIIVRKKMKEGTHETNYKALFIMGISFLPIGIIFTSTISPAFVSFIAIGAVYMAIGLSNRDKWEKDTK